MNAAQPVLKLRLDAKSRRLLLSQPRYSARVQKLILALPDRTWTGSEWTVPIEALPRIRTEFLGIALDEEPSVRAMRTGLPPRAPAPAAPAITDYRFKTEPMGHQKIGFLRGRVKRTFAFLMEMGTGKTKTSIDVFSYHLQRGALDAMIVICPLAVVWNWEREIEMHSPLPPEQRKVVVLAGSSSVEKLAALNAGLAVGANIFVTNYETLVFAKEVFKLFQKLTLQKKVGLLLDESTKIKSPKAKVRKQARKLGLTAQARYILSGSPIDNSPLDAFAQFEFLDWRILGHTSFTSFKSEYAVFLEKGPLRGKKVIEWKNLDRLRSKIAPYSYRVLKHECLDLPAKTYRTVELPMGAKQSQAYEEMRESAVAEVEGQVLAAPIILTKMLRLSQISSGYFPIINEMGKTESVRWFSDEPKISATEDLVEEAIEEGQKVIIWCRGLPELHRLEERLRKFGAVSYHGAVDSSDRQARVDAFQRDPKTRIFIGQTATGGMAITLTAATNVIYYSNSYRLADRLQSEDRAHRIGQRASVTYTDLVCKRSVDKLVISALRNKKSLADVVTGDNLKQLLMET